MTQRPESEAATTNGLTWEERQIRDSARAFVEREIVPVRAELDETCEFPWEVLRRGHAAGFLTAHVPTEYGGSGLGLFTTCLLAEEFGAGCMGIGMSLLVNVLGTSTIVLFGTPEQKARYLPEFCRKLTLFSFACTEPDAGSDIAGIRTEYEQRGSGYVLNGAKTFITNATHADYFTVFARRKDAPRGFAALTAFVVPGAARGINRGPPIRKLGHNASDTAPFSLEDVEVPEDARLGREGEGLAVAVKSLARSRLVVAAASVGLARAALAYALGYVRQRRQFERPLSDFQVVQCEIAAVWEEIEADRALVHATARRYDAGEDVFKHIYACKDHASKMAIDVVGRCLAMLGAYGYSKDFPLEKMVRDARALDIYEGSSTMQRLMIFHELLREGTDPA